MVLSPQQSAFWENLRMCKTVILEMMRRYISIILFLSTAFLSAHAGENAVLIKEEMKGNMMDEN